MLFTIKKTLLLLACLATLPVWGQDDPGNRFWGEERNKGRAVLLHLALGGQVPAADLAKRFGPNLSVGGGLEHITANNWVFGAEGHYLFSKDVKEDPLANLRTPEGDIIGSDQQIASVVLRERGLYVGVVAGRLWVLNQKQRSGLRFTLSAGWLQHKIRVQDDGQTVNQLTGEYLKGYDRLTGGPALQQFVGWQQLGLNRRSNWCVGLEFNQGFTHTLRDWDFAERRKLDGQRFDLRFGIRLGWTLPFYPKSAERIEY